MVITQYVLKNWSEVAIILSRMAQFWDYNLNKEFFRQLQLIDSPGWHRQARQCSIAGLTALSYDFHAFVDTELTRPDHRVIIDIRWEYSISTGVFDNICLFFKTRMNTDFADSFLGWFSIDFLPKCGMSKRISRENEQVCLKILQWNSTIMFFERLCYIANL